MPTDAVSDGDARFPRLEKRTVRDGGGFLRDWSTLTKSLHRAGRIHSGRIHSSSLIPVGGVHLYTMRKEYDFHGGERGPVLSVAKGKTRVTIRLDEDVIEWFREQVVAAGGGNYQSLMNQALREFIKRSKEPLESTLRRVIREELRKAG